jgi:hypothetical protein
MAKPGRASLGYCDGLGCLAGQGSRYASRVIVNTSGRSSLRYVRHRLMKSYRAPMHG